jgi:hypothetical protein
MDHRLIMGEENHLNLCPRFERTFRTARARELSKLTRASSTRRGRGSPSALNFSREARRRAPFRPFPEFITGSQKRIGISAENLYPIQTTHSGLLMRTVHQKVWISPDAISSAGSFLRFLFTLSDITSDWIQTSRNFSRMAGCACSSSGLPENPTWAFPIR